MKRVSLIMIAVLAVALVMIIGQKGALPEVTASSGVSSNLSESRPDIRLLSSAVHRQEAAPIRINKEKVSDSTSKINEKIVYLTFDDGPSKLTDEVLAILKQENVQATFFVLGEQAKRSPEIIYRIFDAGHAIGNHTFDHKYDQLYSGFTQFWGQIKATEEVIRQITGIRPELVRAPGGTYGHFDETYFQLLEQGGYKVFDWDVDSGDSKRKGVPASEIVSNVTSTKLKNEMVVLMHDGTGHAETVKALPEIIQFYKKHGYTFRTISPEQKPVQFSIAPSVKNKAKAAPSLAWIEQNIIPNAELFGPGQPLIIEAGGVQTRLEAGEYMLLNGQYQVPVRTVMERLGAKVKWDALNKTAIVMWDDAQVRIDTRKETIQAMKGATMARLSPVDMTFRSSSLWIPLRSLLESSGQTIVSATSDSQERRVKSM